MTGPSVWGWRPEARGPPAAGAASSTRRCPRGERPRPRAGRGTLVSVKSVKSAYTCAVREAGNGKLGQDAPCGRGWHQVQSPWWGSQGIGTRVVRSPWGAAGGGTECRRPGACRQQEPGAQARQVNCRKHSVKTNWDFIPLWYLKMHFEKTGLN